MTLAYSGDVLRCSGADNRAATIAAFGTKINQPVRRLDDIEIVFNHKNSISLIDQARQNDQQATNIFEMKTSRWLVKQVHRVARRTLCKFARQLHTLRFTARQSGCGLTKSNIAETHINQCLHVTGNRWLI